MEHLELIWANTETGQPRMGLVVPKFRHTGVARNRLRRRLREIWRTEVQPRQGSRDLLIRVREGAYQAPFATLRIELLRWLDAVQTA